MSDRKTPAAGADWTQLLTDPDLIKYLGKLLQTYREAAPEKREQALLDAMREIKGVQGKAAAAGVSVSGSSNAVLPSPTTVNAPPFEPDIFTPSWGQDRRRYPRMKCFIAVELRLDGTAAPVWGNLSDTSLGGCFVETATPVPSGVKAEIGLWVATGKIWVKGLILNGVVTKSSPSFGIRVKFGELGPVEQENLREFLKFVESTTRGYSAKNGYLAQMKR